MKIVIKTLLAVLSLILLTCIMCYLLFYVATYDSIKQRQREDEIDRSILTSICNDNRLGNVLKEKACDDLKKVGGLEDNYAGEESFGTRNSLHPRLFVIGEDLIIYARSSSSFVGSPVTTFYIQYKGVSVDYLPFEDYGYDKNKVAYSEDENSIVFYIYDVNLDSSTVYLFDKETKQVRYKYVKFISSDNKFEFDNVKIDIETSKVMFYKEDVLVQSSVYVDNI